MTNETDAVVSLPLAAGTSSDRRERGSCQHCQSLVRAALFIIALWCVCCTTCGAAPVYQSATASGDYLTNSTAVIPNDNRTDGATVADVDHLAGDGSHLPLDRFEMMRVTVHQVQCLVQCGHVLAVACRLLCLQELRHDETLTSLCHRTNVLPSVREVQRYVCAHMTPTRAPSGPAAEYSTTTSRTHSSGTIAVLRLQLNQTHSVLYWTSGHTPPYQRQHRGQRLVYVVCLAKTRQGCYDQTTHSLVIASQVVLSNTDLSNRNVYIAAVNVPSRLSPLPHFTTTYIMTLSPVRNISVEHTLVENHAAVNVTWLPTRQQNAASSWYEVTIRLSQDAAPSCSFAPHTWFTNQTQLVIRTDLQDGNLTLACLYEVKIRQWPVATADQASFASSVSVADDHLFQEFILPGCSDANPLCQLFFPDDMAFPTQFFTAVKFTCVSRFILQYSFVFPRQPLPQYIVSFRIRVMAGIASPLPFMPYIFMPMTESIVDIRDWKAGPGQTVEGSVTINNPSLAGLDLVAMKASLQVYILGEMEDIDGSPIRTPYTSTQLEADPYTLSVDRQSPAALGLGDCTSSSSSSSTRPYQYPRRINVLTRPDTATHIIPFRIPGMSTAEAGELPSASPSVVDSTVLIASVAASVSVFCFIIIAIIILCRRGTLKTPYLERRSLSRTMLKRNHTYLKSPNTKNKKLFSNMAAKLADWEVDNGHVATGDLLGEGSFGRVSMGTLMQLPGSTSNSSSNGICRSGSDSGSSSRSSGGGAGAGA
eukprot:scpid50799/ scgid28264/ 